MEFRRERAAVLGVLSGEGGGARVVVDGLADRCLLLDDVGGPFRRRVAFRLGVLRPVGVRPSAVVVVSARMPDAGVGS